MVQTEMLNRQIEARGLSKAQVAWHLGMSEQCFARRLKAGRFGSEDIQLLKELLEPERPELIFFA